MKIRYLAAVSLVVSMLAATPVYAAPQTMADGSTFDAEYYAQNNPDVVAAFGTDSTALYNHYLVYGKTEGRAAYAGDLQAYAIISAKLAGSNAAGTAGTAVTTNGGGNGVSVTISATDTSNVPATVVTGITGVMGATDPAAATTTEAPAPASAFELYIQQLIAQVTTADMTQDQKLRAVWNWFLGYAGYKRTYETPSGDWTEQFAQEILTSGKGNCYRYAAAFAYFAKELGYDVQVRTGQISAARGGVTPHGWVVITMNGTEYICDPDMADAKNNWNAYYMVQYAKYPAKPLIAQNNWEINF